MEGPYRVLLHFADITPGLGIMGVLREIVFPIFLQKWRTFLKISFYHTVAVSNTHKLYGAFADSTSGLGARAVASEDPSTEKKFDQVGNQVVIFC